VGHQLSGAGGAPAERRQFLKSTKRLPHFCGAIPAAPRGATMQQERTNSTTSEDHIDRVRSRAETAARLNMSTRTLHRLEQRGEIRRVQVTQRIIGFRDSEIERFLDARTRSA
jgi:hypothetical protein